MKFRNPWIDPRVQNVRPFQLLAYLRAKKWIEVDARISTMRAFRDDQGHGYVLVPNAIGYDRYVQDIIDAVTMLANAEDRYAGDVLTDLLAQPTGNAEATPAIPVIPEKGDPLPQPVNR